MTANTSAPPKRGMTRLWRAILDWDRAINTDPVETMLESLERRVSKLEQKASRGDDDPHSFVHAGQVLPDSRNIDACLTNDS
ncbi:MAG: hypothetical protein WAK55_01215 [Xanthobacteraceae bacterium]|jgi:hypothetical protein